MTVTGLDAGETYQVRVRARYDDNRKSSWSHVATGQAGVTPNSPATAQPTISGTTEVGETLTAGTSSIDDGNGLSDATFTYQWIRNNGSDTDIADATNSRYTLVDADAEATIKVQVSFTDDDGYPESVTSDATAVVTEETTEKTAEEDDKSGTGPREHQALPWAGHTVGDAKAWEEHHIQNAGDSVWLSFSGKENHYYWWYYYDDDDNSLVPNPKMQFYRSNGQPLVMNDVTVEDTLGSGTRRFNLPRLRLMPMLMTPTTCACRRRPTVLANSGSTSVTARSRRQGATATVQTATRDAPTPNARFTLLEPTSRASLSGQT